MPKQIHPGQKVVLRDPRQRKAGGRGPHRQPLTDPCEVVAVKGQKIRVRRPDGREISDIHIEDVIIVPDSTRDLERGTEEDLSLDPEPEDSLEFQSSDLRRSPGMMLEDDGKAVQKAQESLGYHFGAA